MFRTLEFTVLNLLIWFADNPVGWITFFAIGALLAIVQYYRVSGLGWPAIAALFSMGIAALFLASGHTIANYLIGITEYMDSAHSSRPPIPVIEFFFNLLIAPTEKRFFIEELLAVTFTLYFAFVAKSAYFDFSEGGQFLDRTDFSFAGLFAKKQARPKRSKTNELGSGDFATTASISKWTKPTGKPGDTALEVTDLRGSEGTALRRGKIYWGREERNRHALIIAKTGGGKTTKLILPVLYNDCMCNDRSTIVIDSKPEMWRKLAAMTKKYNPKKRILRFNPLDPKISMGWNILSKVDSETDCKLIANTLVMATDQPTAKSDSPFFRNNALAILNAIMVGLLEDQKNGKDTLSMPRIHALVQSGNKNLCSWIESNPKAIRTARTFVDLVRSGSQNADTIMSELSMRIAAWDLQDIRTTTGTSELDLELLVNEPTLFIVEFRESELEMLRPMANVIVIELLRFLTKRAESFPGGALPRPVGLVIDEFASALGQLPDIHVKLNTLRSRNVSIVAAIQSTAQVKANYGDHSDSVLAGFSSKIFMPPLDLVDSEWASKESGQMTVRFKTKSIGSNKKIIEFFASKNDSSQEQFQQRAVLTPDEIGRPVDNITTFFLPNMPVFQGFLVPFYENPEIAGRIKEFDSADKELNLRETPIDYDDNAFIAAAGTTTGGSNGASYGGLPPGISNTAGWSEDQVKKRYEEVKSKLDWTNTTGSAKKWWEAFENENKHRMALVLRLGEELLNRKATVTEFFLAYVYSNTDNIQANLCYLDYTRLKKQEELKKKDAAQKAAA